MSQMAAKFLMLLQQGQATLHPKQVFWQDLHPKHW